MCFGKCEELYSSFRIAGDETTILIECSAEKFESDSVEAFFLVVTNNGQDTIYGMFNVF